MQDTPSTDNPSTPQTPAPEAVAQETVVTAAVAPEPTSEVPAAEVVPSLEELLKAAELKLAEQQDAWLRAKAEGENIRRRAQDDIAKASKFAVEKFAGELLAVKDSLEAALANENQTVETFKSGVELTLRQLISAFEKSSLIEVHPLGEKFDPHKHQAIGQQEADGEPNQVLTVLQKGYTLHDRVIRPALVMVSKARA